MNFEMGTALKKFRFRAEDFDSGQIFYANAVAVLQVFQLALVLWSQNNAAFFASKAIATRLLEK